MESKIHQAIAERDFKALQTEILALKKESSTIDLNDFLYCIQLEDMEAFNLLLCSFTTDIIKTDKEWTALEEACAVGNLEMVEALVNAGADINHYFELIDHCSDDRGTPLTVSLQNDRFEIAKFLIENGADVDAEYYRLEEGPFSEADQGSCAKLVLENEQTELFELMLQKGLNINGTFSLEGYEETLLSWLIQIRNYEQAKQLINLGADVNVYTNDDDLGEVSLLCYMVYHFNKKYADKEIEMIKTFIQNGVNLSTQCKDLNNETVMDLALTSGSKQLIEFLGLTNVRQRFVEEKIEYC